MTDAFSCAQTRIFPEATAKARLVKDAWSYQTDSLPLPPRRREDGIKSSPLFGSFPDRQKSTLAGTPPNEAGIFTTVSKLQQTEAFSPRLRHKTLRNRPSQEERRL
jgi:hypothetical protein